VSKRGVFVLFLALFWAGPGSELDQDVEAE
jgi:hypothetical protein